MTPETFIEHFETFAEAPNGIAKLRELILQLAVQGKLVPQDPNDEPASVLRKNIASATRELVQIGAIAGSPKYIGTNRDDAVPYVLPAGWEWVQLGELGGFLGGGTPSKERREYWDGSIPWVSPKDMKRPYMDDAIDHVSQLGVENSSGKLIPKGSLLMVVRGMILAHSFPVALATRELTINQDMKALLLALPKIGEYLLRCCAACKSRMLENVERSSHGTCRISTAAVEQFWIPLPPLAEQRRIVEKVDQLLGLCDELAARQSARREARSALVGATLNRLVSAGSSAEFPVHAHRLRDHFDRLFDTPTTIPQLRQAILQLAVQGQLVPQDPNDEPACFETTSQLQTSKRQQNTPFNLPENWKWMQLGQVSELINGDRSKNYPNRAEYVAHGVPWINTGHIEPNGTLSVDSMHFISRQKFDSLRSGKVRLGDLVYCLRGATLGKTAIITQYLEGAVASSLVIIRLNQAVDPEFAYFVLTSPLGRTQIYHFDNGSAQPNLSANSVKNYWFPVPPLAEQKRIVSKVTELISLYDALEAKLTQAEAASTQLLSVAVHQLLNTYP